MSTASVLPSIGNAEVGESQRLFAEQSAAKERESIENGHCKPYTVVNFNPVPLNLQGVLRQYSVPSPYDDRLPKEALRFTLPFDGKSYRAHCLTIRFPKKDGKMIGAKSAGAPGEVTSQREPKLYMPQEIAYGMLERFSPVFAVKNASSNVVLPPPPKDATSIYGTLVFEGDIHTLEKVLEEEDPLKRTILTPVCHYYTVGKQSLKSFRTVSMSLDDYLEQMFKGQRSACDAIIMRAHKKWSETQSAGEISERDRMWYRYAITMGWIAAPAKGEKNWLNEGLMLNDATVSAPSNLRKCPGCKAVEPEEGTPFCQKCMRPMDTFKTFMEGHPVPEVYLMVLKGEEREIVLRELQIRRSGFEITSPVVPVAPAVAPVVAAAPEKELSRGEKAAATRAANEAKAAAELSKKTGEPLRASYPETEDGTKQFQSDYIAWVEKKSSEDF